MNLGDPAVLSPLVVGLISGIGSIYIGAEGHPKSEYKDEVANIQDDRWNDVCSALGPVFADVYAHVDSDDNDTGSDDLTESDRAGFLIRQALDGRSDLEDLEETLERLDEPKRVYRECRRRWKRSLFLFGLSITLSVLATFSVWVSTGLGSLVIGIFAVAVSVMAFILAGRDLLKYLDQKERLNEMLEEVDFM